MVTEPSGSSEGEVREVKDTASISLVPAGKDVDPHLPSRRHTAPSPEL